MSLINDALKRAKAAQQQAPLPQADLPFRPVEPAQQRARRGLGLMLPAVLALVACLGLFLVWQFAQTRDAAAPIEVTARTAPIPAANPAPPPAPATAPAAPSQPAQAPQPALPSQRGPVALDTAAAAPAVAAPAVADAATEPADLMAADVQKDKSAAAEPVAAPPPPKLPPLRLQAIVFDPKRPSAMINGKLVFIGDRLRDLRVVRIDQESATLVGAGLTNVLTLWE